MNKARGRIVLASLAAGLCVLLCGAKAPVKHTADLYVNDYANVISAGDKAAILAVARQLEQSTGAQVAVLTVDSLEGGDIAAYAHEVAESWKLGRKGEDNGVLLVLSTGDRLSRIEVGYGLEGTLTDILTGRIQDTYMIPHFSEGDYSAGLRSGVEAVAASIYQHYGLEVPATLPAVSVATQDENGMYSIVSMFVLILLIVLLNSRRRGGGAFIPFLFFPHGGGRGGGMGGGGTFGGGGGFGGGGSSRKF